jgi:hypothetical protein
VAQGINGVTSQVWESSGSGVLGKTAWNSAYTPFYYTDSEQIHRSDDMQGTNQISYDGGFYGAYGLALDSAGRIYIADTYNCRVVRIDDMNGTNFTSFGTCGTDVGQFNDPSGIAVDGNGRIYVLDTNNCRVTAMDDMNGTNWASYGTCGSGVGQFAPYYLAQLAVDSSSRIYVADTANLRVARFDDMTGTNWTTLSQGPQVNGGTPLLQGPVAVTLDAAGRIYIADNGAASPAVVRVDDMTGANWTSVDTYGSTGFTSISVDSGGTVFLGGGGAHLVINMTAVLNSSGSVGPIGSYYVFGVTSIPVPTPRPSAVGLFPSTLTFAQNVGATSPAQSVVISNFGGNPLDLGNISASAGYNATNNCPSQLVAGTTCTVSVTFTPPATGETDGLLTVMDDSGNAGSAQVATLFGTGTAPVASITPSSMGFQSQVINTTSSPRNVTIQNTGTGPLQITSATTAAPFAATTACTTVAPGASCTVQVTFSPTAVGQASGTLTIMDNAGTGTQTVALNGSGVAPVSLSPTSLSFGSVAVGFTSAAKNVTLTNRQSVTLNLSSISPSTGFAVSSTTCGASLAAGANCTISVTFSATAIGSVTGTLTVTDDAINSPQTASLSGSGTAPTTLSASSLSFNSTAVGNTSSARSVTLTNNQGVALSFSSIAATAGFSISSNTCGSSIAAAASCTVGVKFIPTSVGSATGMLTFTDDAGNSPQIVSLTGTGTAPVTFSSSTLNFGTITVGSTSSSKSVTVTNRLSTSLSLASITASAGFVISSNSCGTSLAAGANCTVSVKFAPTAAGTISGSLTFTDSALTSPQSVTLNGTGQ